MKEWFPDEDRKLRRAMYLGESVLHKKLDEQLDDIPLTAKAVEGFTEQ